ncbi:TetR family transcriptional regulator [Nocardia sp. CDC159]|uniref:TetR family transcriptional regulator n=1 Tax=Nocardia pulmonis TaxID=2951408 RepID=A0A9X2E564_9NOCA|nr:MULTISPECIES: TetR/AcrR family transcriptional regulator [Nocardia]MCM6773268.1 TetR family transcriptional regulator [Nocardia pulmonis]MCM6786155.1 TetR family transcriptional regulator [Nocardia sp. CDC159]
MTDTADRPTRLADAAIETLARHGMRGLTHRAVDKAADLPEGSCSNHFRTREALLVAAVTRLAELDTAEIRAAETTFTDPDTATTALATLLDRWLTTDRHRMLARYELSLEATRRPELRNALSTSGARLRTRAEQALAALGAADPAATAPTFVACLDGLIFDRLAGAGDPTTKDLRTAVHTLLRAFLA